jgi:hypothetical protein
MHACDLGRTIEPEFIRMTDHIQLRDLTTDDATELIALFRSCYGETYGNSTFYENDKLCQAITDKTVRSVVAMQSGRIVGHMAMTVRHPESKVCETGNTVVHPDARGQGLLGMLGQALHERVIRDGFIGTANYPTTAHEIMQRAAVAGGAIETGVMLAYVASHTTDEVDDQSGHRLAAVVCYQPMAPIPDREVYLPTHYRKLIEDLYARIDSGRTALSPIADASMLGQAHADIHYNERRGSLHMYVHKPGANLGAVLSGAVRLHQPYVTYIDLPLDDPHIDATINTLKEEGVFYCGLMPEYARTDVLRLQVIHKSDPKDFEPNLANPEAQRLCAFIRSDVPTLNN